MVQTLENKPKGKKFRILALSVLILAIIVGACAGYLGDYYKADLNAIEAFAAMNAVTIETLDDSTMVFKPQNPTAGFIFYPGGKVEYTAYQPLMAACAEQGLLCVLVEMPFHLAIFDMNAAEGIQEQCEEIDEWYIGGHSLGGVMAASYLAEHMDEYEGLILLGSYTTEDFSETDLEVLSVYGSEDKVLNSEKYNESKSNLPSDFVEVVLDGGCHAYFGMYGEQEGDGVPTMSNEEQIFLTVENILEMME